jgi:hypothetical protein
MGVINPRFSAMARGSSRQSLRSLLADKVYLEARQNTDAFPFRDYLGSDHLLCQASSTQGGSGVISSTLFSWLLGSESSSPRWQPRSTIGFGRFPKPLNSLVVTPGACDSGAYFRLSFRELCDQLIDRAKFAVRIVNDRACPK